ncbi:MAG: hypothetical protein IH597_08885 [Bacteroidales bacterium]|nr:hypothetical protein [Bacteroidales bacterium]
MYKELHLWANSLRRYSFDEIGKLSRVANGIYLVFEKGEKFEDLDKIVRVGSHPSPNRFFKRLNDHFMGHQRQSIMRKHVGRCFLNKSGDPYIAVWNLTNSGVKKGSEGEKLVDRKKEQLLEGQIDDYLTNFSMAVIPNLGDTTKRIQIETSLIAMLAQESSLHISKEWLGLHHPDSKISKGGLWNIQGLNRPNILSENDFHFIREKSKNEQA